MGQQERFCAPVMLFQVQIGTRKELHRPVPRQLFVTIQAQRFLPLDRRDDSIRDFSGHYHPFPEPKAIPYRKHRHDALPRHRLCPLNIEMINRTVRIKQRRHRGQIVRVMLLRRLRGHRRRIVTLIGIARSVYVRKRARQAWVNSHDQHGAIHSLPLRATKALRSLLRTVPSSNVIVFRLSLWKRQTIALPSRKVSLT